MKKIFLIALVTLLLGACATPYYPIYVNDSGDYYIAEKESSVAYYGSGGSSLNYIGMYPWWEFSYYSPYFYPYYFSVWHPPRYYYWYGTYGWYGYYPTYYYAPYYYSPYRRPIHRSPAAADQPITAEPVVSSRPPASPYLPTDPAIQIPIRQIEAESRFRDAMYGGQRRVYDVSTKSPGTASPSPVTPRSVYQPSRTTSIPSYSRNSSGRSVGPSGVRSTSRSSSMKSRSVKLYDKD